MAIPREYAGRYFYHFTHIDNIPSIIAQGGLLCTNRKNKRHIEHHNIANINIQARRSGMKVLAGPGGYVHDYVPFYFASVNPMLLSLLNCKVVDQPYICFIAVPIERLLEDDVIFTDASANTNIPPNFYEDPEDLNHLNWVLIDSRSWGCQNDYEKHARMAEALVYKEVPLDWIESYIVFDNIAKKTIIDCYKDAGIAIPNIAHKWFNNRPFYYTKHFFDDRKYETLVTGPIQLYQEYVNLIRYIIQYREVNPPANSRFQDISDALGLLTCNFCSIPEMKDIYDLETDNPMHHETVGGHTLQVVRNLEDSVFGGYLGPRRKAVVRLAAYLHDIGKGPRSKWDWNNGVQKAYPDHPADSIPMLARILTEDFEELDEKEIQWICLLVVYHDLMGDIISNGRSREELLNLDLSKKDMYMLAALAEADVRAINGAWAYNLECNLSRLITTCS